MVVRSSVAAGVTIGPAGVMGRSVALPMLLVVLSCAMWNPFSEGISKVCMVGRNSIAPVGVESEVTVF